MVLTVFAAVVTETSWSLDPGQVAVLLTAFAGVVSTAWAIIHQRRSGTTRQWEALLDGMRGVSDQLRTEYERLRVENQRILAEYERVERRLEIIAEDYQKCQQRLDLFIREQGPDGG